MARSAERPAPGASMFCGRSVCIVGNGPYDELSLGEDVDGHEVVVRFNDARFGGVLGRRVDFYVTTLRKEVRTTPKEMIRRGAQVVTLTRANAPEALGGQDESWHKIGLSLERELGCWPSSGLAVFREAVRQRAKRVTLVAMDLAPRFEMSGSDPSSPPPARLYHNFVGERRIFALLVRKAQAFGIHLSLSPGLQACVPGPRGTYPTPDRIDAFLEQKPHVALERLRGQAPSAAGRSEFTRIVREIASTFPSEFRVVRAAPRMTRSADACRLLERFLFVPSGRGVRGHPWWLYDAGLLVEVERLASTLRRTGRAFVWMAPADLEANLRSRFCSGPLSLLGLGVEGPVFTDGQRVFKCLTDPDNWRPHEAMLRSLPNRPSCEALPDVIEAARIGETLVVASRHEAFEPYRDATVAEWQDFVSGMRKAGLCARNIKASNLVRVRSGLRFVDLGNSLRPWSNSEAEEMALRCYLLGRFGARRDLIDLMHKCVRDRSHPALEGFAEFTARVGLSRTQSVRTAPVTPKIRPASDGPPYSLLIKLCAMDHEFGSDFVTHLTRTFGSAAQLDEVLVIVDSRKDGFLRQFAPPDRGRLLERLREPQQSGVIHQVVEVPDEAVVVGDTYARWFGLDDATGCELNTHADNGQQLFATLFGIDACRNDRVIALDGDMLFWRHAEFTDWRSRVEEVFREHQSVVFVSPPICLPAAASPTLTDDRGPYRPCPRASVIARDRLRALLPLVVKPDSEGRLPAWHRALHGVAPVARLHDSDWGLIHVPNFPCKREPQRLLEILDRIEAGWRPNCQLGSQELAWDGDWDGPGRNEPFVFVVAGRNVPKQRIQRCIDSVRRQRGGPWGAIVIDDCSDNGSGADLEHIVDRDPRVTLIRNRRRRGYLPNLVRAVSHVMRCGQSVAVLVDLDDCLIGDGVLERLTREYDNGADLTVGSMFRTDKHWRYPPDFNHPRSARGDVWQHLRTFRKALFDRLPLDAMRRPDGTWYDTCTDWAFMVPLVELASAPRYIKDTLYYYDAPTKSEKRRQRQHETIQEILNRPPVRAVAARKETP